MDHPLFSSAFSNYYVRCYKINPELFNGIHVEVNAECSPNTADSVSGRYYLELYFSAEEIGFREHITGFCFGAEQMDKKSLDKEIDKWVELMITEPTFPPMLQDYLDKFAVDN